MFVNQFTITNGELSNSHYIAVTTSRRIKLAVVICAQCDLFVFVLDHFMKECTVLTVHVSVTVHHGTIRTEME